MKMKKLIMMLLMAPAIASAQGSGAGHVGGGEITASDFQDFINEIDAYLLTPEGREQFKDVIEQPKFHNIVTQVRPVVKDEPVYDSFGVRQTCISNAQEGNRYFQCDLSRLPKLELDNQPSFYRLTFHELLFQVGKELPISKDVPSDFSISSSLNLIKRTFHKYVPVAPVQFLTSQNLKDLTVTSDTTDRSGRGSSADFRSLTLSDQRFRQIQKPWPFDSGTQAVIEQQLIAQATAESERGYQELRNRLDSVATRLKIDPETFQLQTEVSKPSVTCQEKPKMLDCSVFSSIGYTIKSFRADVIIVREQITLKPLFAASSKASKVVNAKMIEPDVLFAEFWRPWADRSERTVMVYRIVLRGQHQ